MGEEEFDRLEPKEIAAYMRAWVAKQQREDYRAATIACMIGNLFIKEGAKPIEPADIFPSLPRAPRSVDEKRLAEKIRAVAVSLGAVMEANE